MLFTQVKKSIVGRLQKGSIQDTNLLKPTGHVMHQQF